ncbi:diacylglycerol/lipid kinase family protein [Algihabitans albus]|uniref:diacylglycerol/lipid kinase family protein n=1 Tax=Algihabitans albus TaxID=2164067 RepID=UPI000E5D80EE|nr:diacylglycerol kinase family protein [Algihabitans albus]
MSILGATVIDRASKLGSEGRDSGQALPHTAAIRRVQVIFNPTAGGAKRQKYHAVLDRLLQAGVEVDERPTGRRGDAEAFAAELERGACDRLVVAGGDGTINEAINGLGQNRAGGATTPLALLPLGTANVLALEIGLSTSSAKVARAILEGPVHPVTLGEANGRRFTLMAGVGFDAHVVAQVSKGMKRRLGKGAYIYQTMRQIGRFDFPSYNVRIDGVEETVASAVVANARYYGGRFVMAPEAQLQSGTLEVCLFDTPGRAAALKYAAALALGLLPRLSDFRIVTGRQIRIQGPVEDPVQGDGDIVAALPAEVRVLPDALNLVFPSSRR